MNNTLALFEEQYIRKVWFKDEWWFVIVDIVKALTGSKNPSGYLKDMRRRDDEISKGWGQIATPLEVLTKGGKQKMNCANTEGCFRIIQSIPSPKAEPFKRWLSKVGKERLDEIENPELAMERMKELYKKKGYPKDWIEKRTRGIAVRHSLTDERDERGVKKGREYAILTAEISKATFGMTPSEYKKYKGLDKENLRDHMTDLELIFTMLGEASTTEIMKTKNSQGFDECKDSSEKGGKVAGNARKQLELESGNPVSEKTNYLRNNRKQKKLEG